MGYLTVELNNLPKQKDDKTKILKYALRLDNTKDSWDNCNKNKQDLCQDEITIKNNTLTLNVLPNNIYNLRLIPIYQLTKTGSDSHQLQPGEYWGNGLVIDGIGCW